MIEWLIKIFIWLVLAILLTIIPFHLERSKQRYKLTPFITYSIIGINVLIFLVMIVYTILQDPTFYSRVINYWGFKPHAFLNPSSDPQGFFGLLKIYLTLITHQFLHGGFFHILGNMFFLHIFAPDIEMGQNIGFRGHTKLPYNRLIPFLGFYLLCGIGAALAHTFVFGFTDPQKTVLIGASGAISGVLAAFLLKCWKDSRKLRIQVLYYIPKTVSANLYLIYWIILQFALAFYYGNKGSVGYVAHLGGALTGFVLSGLVFPWNDIIVKSQRREWLSKRKSSFS